MPVQGEFEALEGTRQPKLTPEQQAQRLQADAAKAQQTVRCSHACAEAVWCLRMNLVHTLHVCWQRDPWVSGMCPCREALQAGFARKRPESQAPPAVSKRVKLLDDEGSDSDDSEEDAAEAGADKAVAA